MFCMEDRWRGMYNVVWRRNQRTQMRCDFGGKQRMYTIGIGSRLRKRRDEGKSIPTSLNSVGVWKIESMVFGTSHRAPKNGRQADAHHITLHYWCEYTWINHRRWLIGLFWWSIGWWFGSLGCGLWRWCFNPHYSRMNTWASLEHRRLDVTNTATSVRYLMSERCSSDIEQQQNEKKILIKRPNRLKAMGKEHPRQIKHRYITPNTQHSTCKWSRPRTHKVRKLVRIKLACSTVSCL